MPIQIYNVLTKNKEPFSPVVEGEVRFYLCGVTVYGRCHVGNLRSNLSFDAIVRYFKYRGYKLRYIRNLTDIDDKIIKRALEITEGREGNWRNGEEYKSYTEDQWNERLAEDERIIERSKNDQRHLAEIVADHFIHVLKDEDLSPFGLLEPTSEPRVSEHIPQVVDLINKIINNGFAYEADGDVYFDVPKYHDATEAYGKLSGRDYTQLIDGARVAPTDKKKSAPDFALWKKANPEEPAWESPWGKGRPGWHIECSAMSVEKLGQPFDIHGGGKDLIFPHHENEIAQSEAAAGTTFCNTWMHNGFLTVDGVKMSKSLGNFLTIKEALAIAPPEVWKLLILGNHYSKPIDLSLTGSKEGDDDQSTRGTINIAFDRLTYFYETLAKARALASEPVTEAEQEDIKELYKMSLVSDFEESMDDDFNTAKALASIGEGMKHLNELCDMKAKKTKKLKGGKITWLGAVDALASDIEKTLGVLGLCENDPEQELVFLRDFAAKRLGLNIEDVENILSLRSEARAAKDFAKSDSLRDELLKMGVEIKDSPDGTTWKVVQ